jgi:hypothetical protein
MIGAGILAPVVALAAWTMIMWLWMYATRIPAMQKTPELGNPAEMVGSVGADLRSVLPPGVNWKADNYNHLHEAPTVFYAIAITLAITGQGDGFNLWLGWAYVALRVVHSLVQATMNKVVLRFAIFALSSLVLMALTFHAAIVVFDIHF